ncbi:MANSC domain-containing protein 1, partial [Chaetura pelagica]
GGEPLYTPSPGACVRACCSEEKLSGDKKCNLVIFSAQRTSAHPNCYLFYCPSTEACPMKSAIGYVSYKITRETPATQDTSFKNEVFSSNGYSLSSDAGAFISPSQTSPHSPTTALHQLVFRQASELPNSVTKHLDNSEFRTTFPDSQRTKHPESLDPIPDLNLPSNKPAAGQIGNPSTSFPTTQSTVPELSSTTLAPLSASTSQQESHTTSLPTGGTTPTALTITTAAFLPTASTTAKTDVPDTTFAVTRVPLSTPTTSGSTTTTKWVTTNFTSATTPSGLRTPTIPQEPTVVSPNDTSQVTFLSSSGSTLSTSNSPTASQSHPEGYDPSDSESYLPEGILREKGVNQLGEKSSLIAALLFEVIFLLLVIVLTGKKIHESLRKRPYTRLDYLINGMYADV